MLDSKKEAAANLNGSRQFFFTGNVNRWKTEEQLVLFPGGQPPLSGGRGFQNVACDLDKLLMNFMEIPFPLTGQGTQLRKFTLQGV